MQVQLKNIDILNIMDAFQEINSLDLPVKVSWNITKNVKKIAKLYRDYSEYEQELVKKYAIKDEEGEVRVDDKNQYKIAPAQIAKFNKERAELLECENDIDITPINIDDLEGNIKPSTLFNLSFMILDEVE